MIANQITFPVAFFSGVVSFFAPCVVPLLPVYVSYITGVSLNSLREDGYQKYRKKMLISSLLYVLGFSFVFTLLGVAAAGIGSYFRIYARELQIFSGVVLVIFALEFYGAIKINIFEKNYSFRIPKRLEQFEYFRAFFIGMLFAVTWTPCVGAVLGGILALAASSSSWLHGGLLLFVYSLGISLPFMFVSLSLTRAPKYLKIIQSQTKKLNRLVSIILLILGLLLITGYYADVNGFVFSTAYGLGYRIK